MAQHSNVTASYLIPRYLRESIEHHKQIVKHANREDEQVMAQSALQQVTQDSFPGICPVEDALTKLAQAGIEERGAIFTKREVVEFILDLVNYTTDRPLHEIRLLEPSFGGGDFLLIAIERLFKAWSKRKGNADPEEMLANAIRAVELHDDTFRATREKVIAMLKAEGLETKPATTLADTWLIKGDFLLTPLPFAFDCVVGNPPYVRQELIPAALKALSKTLLSKEKPASESGVKEMTGVAAGAEPWILESFDQLALVRRLERDFPLIEEVGCKIGVGVATGADQAFIGPYDELDVEPDRKLPLAMTRDIITGTVK